MDLKATKPLQGLKILAVDDSADILRFLEMGLKLCGAETRATMDPQEALKLAPGGGFDVIFIDIMMPEMDGFQLAGALRKAGCTTPLVALTGLRESEQAKQGAAAGFSDYLSKPMELQDLVNKALQHAGRNSGS